MSFGSLKTLKLERTLGDATLSITTHVPIDADESIEFGMLDLSIVKSASALREFNPEIKAEAPIRAEVVATIPEAIPEVIKEDKPV